MVALTPLAWLQALAAEIGLTLVYALYGYLFHLGFDHLRPVEAAGGVEPERVSPRWWESGSSPGATVRARLGESRYLH